MSPVREGPVTDEIARRRQIEDTFWRTSPEERPESDAIRNIVNKAQDASILLDILEIYRDRFQGAISWRSTAIASREPRAFWR